MDYRALLKKYMYMVFEYEGSDAIYNINPRVWASGNILSEEEYEELKKIKTEYEREMFNVR